MAIQLEDLVARLRLDDSGFNTSGVSSKLQSTTKKMQSTGRSMTLGLTVPIVGAGIAAVKMAGDFDQTLRKIGIATDAPTEKLEKLALQMGAETAFSAGEAADAMLELAKGGMTAATIQGGALQATMKLAAAGGVGLADAATYMNNSMAAFGLTAKDADAVTVALAGGANASSASVESLGQGLSQVASTAHTAGLGLDETVAVLSALDAQGVKGSDAGTSLKTMLNSLIPTTDKQTAAMEHYGLSFQDAAGNMDSAQEIAGKLHGAFGDLSEAERLHAIRTIFGSDAQRAANALVDVGAKGLGKYIDATHDSETANKLADASMQGVSGAIEKAKGSLETAAIVIGQSLAPVVADLAGKVEDLANWFAGLDEGQRELIIKAALLAAALGPVLVITAKLITATSTLVRGGSAVLNFVGGLGNKSGEAATKMQKLAAAARLAAGAAGLGLLFDATRRAPGAMSTLEEAAGGAAIGAMFGPWGAVIGGAAGALHGMWRQQELQIDMAEDGIGPNQDYAATFDEISGKATEATRKLAYLALTQSKYVDDAGNVHTLAEAAGRFGISLQDLVDASTGVPGASKKIHRAFRDINEQIEGRIAKGKPYEDLLNDLGLLQTVLPKVSKDIRKQGRDWKNEQGAVHDYSDAQERAARQIGNASKDILGSFRPIPAQAHKAGKSIKDIEKAKPDLGPLKQKMSADLQQLFTGTSAKSKQISTTTGQNLSNIHVNTGWTRPWLGSIDTAAAQGRSKASAAGAGVGFALSSGIAGGITGAVYLVTNAAAAAVQAGVDAARRKADAHSPSRVMMQLGRDMGEGLALGYDESRDTVARSFSALAGTGGGRVTVGSSVNRSDGRTGGSRTRPLRITLDVGKGRTFNGWLDDEFDGRDELVGTRRRMGR